MIMLTGATGLVGSELLRRLTIERRPVRCLVRDPRQLGAERVRVQIALGDLGVPQSFRHALRGVKTVVHLAASMRDQGNHSIEELNGVATWRLVRAAERAGVERFIFFSALNAVSFSPARFFRAKALAEDYVERSSIPHVVFAPSFVYSPDDSFLTLLDRMSLLPVMPIAGRGKAEFQPIWASDVADCIMVALDGRAEGDRYELAGPDTLTYNDVVRLALRSFGRPRPLVHVPMGLVRRGLDGLERLVGPPIFATAEEAELLAVPMTTRRGTADAERLGVSPRRMAEILSPR